MTIEQFLARFKRHAHKFRSIGSLVREVDPKAPSWLFCRCPIEVVAGIRSRGFIAGARKLGLTRAATDHIVAAADTSLGDLRFRAEHWGSDRRTHAKRLAIREALEAAINAARRKR